MPEKNTECLVENSFLKENNKKIGDKITLDIEKQTNDEGEEIDYLEEKELTIIGTVRSPLYISKDRGTSTLGAGKVSYYMYIPKENIKANEIYTNIYIKVKESEKYKTSSKAYEDYIQEAIDNIEEIKEEREKERHDTLVRKITRKGRCSRKGIKR